MVAEIMGRKYPMAYTVYVQNQIAERFGGLEKMQDAFELGGAASAADNTVFMAAAMMLGYVQRERVRAKLLGDDCELDDPPSYEDLRAVLSNGEVIALSKAVANTLAEGTNATVEVKPEKGKNAAATQGISAPLRG